MDDYVEVPTAPPEGEAHHCPPVAPGGEVLPQEYSLAELVDGAPVIPPSWSRDNDDITVVHDNIEVMQGCADDMSLVADLVLFQHGVFVFLFPDDPEMPESFAEQFQADLVHYRAPIHRWRTRDAAIGAFLSTAAWWRHHVRESFALEDQKLILRALYKLSCQPYLSPGHPPAFTSTDATFQSRTDPASVVAIVSAQATYRQIGVIVSGREFDDGEEIVMTREEEFAKEGLDAMRYAKIQPRAISVHRSVL